MRVNPIVLISMVLAVSGIGCSASGPKNALDRQEERSRDPMTMEFSQGAEATEWLMDMKHTLRGVNLEDTQAVCQELLKCGATELRVADVLPDSQDPTYSSAGKLIVRLPNTPKGRTDVLTYIGELSGEPPPADTNQDLVEIVFPLRR